MPKNKEKKQETVSALARRMQGFRRFRRLLLERWVVTTLILFQFAAWILLLWSGATLYREIYNVLHLLSVFLAFYVIFRRDPLAYKLLWVTLLLLFPIPGLVIYALLKSERYRNYIRAYLSDYEKETAALLPTDDGASYGRTPTLLSRFGFPIYPESCVSYYPLGDDKWPALLAALESAERYIFLEYFIIDEGEMWESVLSILRKKRDAGVKIRIMMDDIGCFLLRPRRYARELRQEGFEVVVFNHLNPFISSTQNARDHRKIVSIDGVTAFTGGVNLADEYINRRDRFGHWKDTAVQLRGEGAWSFTVMFLRLWNLAKKEREDFSAYVPQTTPNAHGETLAVPYASSPMAHPVARELYLSMFGDAEKYLYVTTPYLIPDETLSDALCLAAESGVDVRVIVPKHADKQPVNIITKYHYRPLLRAGVRIYEYTPGFIHAKTVVSEKAASVGSANLDYRSLYLSFESGLYMEGAAVSEVKRDMEQTLAVCEEITGDPFRGHPVRRAMAFVLKIFEPLL